MHAYPDSKLVIDAQGFGFDYSYESDELLGEAINNPTTKEQLIKQFSRLNDTVFELVSSILKNDCNKAMKLYYNFINNGMDVSQIIAIIASQIRLLFQVKRLYNSGKSNEEIAKILEFKSPYRVKYLLNDCYYYSEDDLIKYLSKLADIDKNIKSGNGDGKFLLELFIAKKDM